VGRGCWDIWDTSRHPKKAKGVATQWKPLTNRHKQLEFYEPTVLEDPTEIGIRNNPFTRQASRSTEEVNIPKNMRM
jgi:hypothetical protein